MLNATSPLSFARTLGLALVVMAAGQAGSARADHFNCYEDGNCDEPDLETSATCLEGTDYTVTNSEVGANVTVLSIHGGSIESRTSDISAALAARFGWNRFDFRAHGTSTCLSGMTNFQRLHITSTHFDHEDAVAMVEAHPHAVAIHGYGASRAYSAGTICVGGADAEAVQAFIEEVNEGAGKFTPYTLTPVDATTATGTQTCAGLGGVDEDNIVNLTSTDAGLQLEMSLQLREDLVKSGASYDYLRDLIYSAIQFALEDSELGTAQL